MSGASEKPIGTCDVCQQKDKYLQRTTFHYESIKCDCHSPNHFEIVWHCETCTPVPPRETKVEVKPHKIPPFPRLVLIDNLTKLADSVLLSTRAVIVIWCVFLTTIEILLIKFT